MKTQTASSLQRSETAWTAEYRVISDVKPKTVAYRLTQTTTVTTKKPGSKEHVDTKVNVTEGITRHRVLMAHLRGARVGVEPIFRTPKQEYRGGILCMATPELLDFHAKQGCDWSEPVQRAYWREHSELGPPRPGAEEKPLTALEAGASEDLVVFLDWSNHQIFTRTKEPLPWAKVFEYISAHIDNGHYDLKKLVEVLTKRDDVVLVPEKYGDSFIQTIPGYNATAARNQTVTFLWQPSVEDYRAMVDECERLGGSYPSTNWRKAVFTLDLLGLRAGGAAKYDDFHECDPEPEDDSDDDGTYYGGRY